MSWLAKKLFGLAGASAPREPVIAVPPQLPALGPADTGAVARRAGLPPPPGNLSKPDYISHLLQAKQPMAVVGFLAHALPAPKAVLWASESCDLVRSRQSPADQQAAAKARAWAVNPSVANRQAATDAAAAADYAGPGAWAAQAAAWSAAPAEAAQNDPEVTAGLVGKAVAGSVMLSAALADPNVTLPPVVTISSARETPAPAGAAPWSAPVATVPEPPPAGELLSHYQPMIERGLQLAAGAA